ncbi:alkene reductase [Paraburkholderia caballeronis]|uniref:N-ethylmaleimide reductase n=1 Tax=Paraburkholderia caballeronis TaxID=416943 RepID=A0A1H7FC34_9BURK|nr:alkene reductase [Paraburkholderia caballeronis]PXW23958.1 N-ethylmaleimide reductase [Paraburkholderia caballeronis]PXW99722.1 N-ethylmaleimide reductase [Paraburkholderia caballeronis]RAJ96676.1 N-ethylmaleimide reductase [Paraburkholderia caballeronis]SEE77371.1 N-ethylmaleimide reductase [Paraburkholderia caballeronis]SEK20785.1 N-ethylmaleimide reductase [Paraburkholderia caballeronis]
MTSPASPLFTPTTVAGLPLPHRIVMAPMTRARSTQPGDIPNAMMAGYYAQRAGAALIVTEATQISPQGKGYSFTPGVYSADQVAGWKLVTDAVHAAGGRIFLQLWHVGRMSHPDFHGGELPVAPSAVPFDGSIWKVDPATGVGAMVACPTPRALSIEEIHGIVADFRHAARNAMAAGFDGVEIHGANGYLIDQFLRTTSNLRTDEYGGSRENRLRFLMDVVNAVADEVGAERTAIRLAPFLTARGMNCPDIPPTMLEAAGFLQWRGIGYLHLVEADWDDAPQFTEAFRQDIRGRFTRPIIVAGKYDKARAEWVLSKGYADLVAFGRPFVANPDLPRRLAENLPLADFDGSTLFGGTEHGYSDYPDWADEDAATKHNAIVS